MLTVEGGIIMAVSCHRALSLSTLEIASHECLLSFLIYAGSQTMDILQTFDGDPDGGCIIHKVVSLSFCLELSGCTLQGIPFLTAGFP